MTKFNVGDKIKDSKFPYIYTVRKIDKQNGRYYIISNDGFSLWSSCIGYEKVPIPDEILRYGEVLTDDEFECDILDSTGFQISETNYYRIRTISYESRIFYHKMMNGEVVEFKELTV